MSKAIQVQNLSKVFTIRHEGQKNYLTLRDTITSKAGKIISFPFSISSKKRTGTAEEYWALKNLAFTIERGDRVGIIGRNGAGKSTLLKVLSRITEPTKGTVKIKGRVASLLEVGTGFHPELSGRENIFMNGAILGMSRQEIRKKFDEIVAFAGVEKHIDTPVKRYSSGMYVRLAFGVAAHLEPEILIVDEVLAVGDMEFQKKALGKMKEVSNREGRTVLLVSHNMAAIQNLCQRAILLNHGHIDYTGNVNDVIGRYLSENGSELSSGNNLEKIQNRSGKGNIIFSSFYVERAQGLRTTTIFCGDDVRLCFELRVKEHPVSKIDLGFSLHNVYDDMQTYLYSGLQRVYYDAKESERILVTCTIKEFPFGQGRLYVKGRLLADGQEADWPKENLGVLNIEWGDFYQSGTKAHIDTPFLIKAVWE